MTPTSDISEPQFLFHYTSIQGLIGILKSRSVWASGLLFMNDSREWLYTVDLLQQEIAKRFLARNDRNWTAFLADLSKIAERIEKLNICVFSMSAAANQLSQWRAYCPSEGGYELCFDFRAFR